MSDVTNLEPYAYEARPQTLGRKGDERGGTPGPFPGSTRGRNAEAEMPEAHRSANPSAAMARGRRRARELADRISGVSLAGSVTAKVLRTICQLDLSELESVKPPRGFGRD